MNCKRGVKCSVSSIFSLAFAAALLAGWCGPALAQSNSLLHPNGRTGRPSAWTGQAGLPAPTTQPAAGALSPGAGIAIRPAPPVAVSDPADQPPQNQTLLALSPIAVRMPKSKKIQVNDLVTVIIRESRTSVNDAKMKSEKDWQMKAELAKWLRLDNKTRGVPQKFNVNGTPGVDWDFQNTYEGKGNYDRKDELTTRITATVIDVKPNGNLVLEATKEVRSAADEKLMATLTGECRNADVTAQNTVLSTQIANLKIEVLDTGAVRDATQRGWLMRLFDFAKPI